MSIELPILLIQLGLFLYVLFVLNFLVFKPIMRILAKRDEVTVGRTGAAENFQNKMGELQEKIDSEIAKLRNSLDDHRQETIKRNRELAETKLRDAKLRMEKQLGEKRGVLTKEFESVRARLPQMTDSVAKEIVQAVSSSRVVRL